MDKSIDISPGVSILGVLSHLNYEPWYALAEYVDNAIQSYKADKDQILENNPDFHLSVNIDIDTDGAGRIVIEDNAGGIHRDQFARAFRAAEVPPDRTGLSEFGMGMKSASIWFAKNWSVETTSIGDPNVYRVHFDMTEVLRGSMSELQVETQPSEANSHYTRITMWDLNQVPRGRTLGKIRDHVRDIYRSFLRSGEMRLVVAGQRMSFSEPSILRAAEATSDSTEIILWRKSIDIQLSPTVRVSGFAALRDEGSTKDAGFALLRRGRVILGSGDSPYRPAVIYGRGNSYRSQRLFGELTIDGVPVSHTKDGFQWGEHEEAFLERLRAELDADPLRLLRQAENYRSRTITRNQSRVIEDATEKTTRAAAVGLPNALASIAQSEDADEFALTSKDSANLSEDYGDVSPEIHENQVNRVVEFELAGQQWHVEITAGAKPVESAWLERSVNRVGTTEVNIYLGLNSDHEFVRQFALGDKDSFEAILRLAISLVVAESLTRDAGLTFTSTMFRNINRVLTEGLSARVER
ncbi:ATP-binding protein [Rathayibacter sp. AY1D9]|uniref:ATP-binding protein n=1 Tax=Rathayibacter sp. AY1D9 TaxID=2080548 RepID=UPI000CE77E4C|nr:ATP-binding protein [Rathayibacter sp. AY1D9]PPH78155.1 ATP-binding protein [Rathayibacter sp. AY1D9]